MAVEIACAALTESTSAGLYVMSGLKNVACCLYMLLHAYATQISA